MHAQTQPTNHAAFDKLYEKVPPDQIDRLRHFRLTHPYKSLIVDDIDWEYISCGQGAQGLLLLPGALSIGESMFPFISAFENEYRIIAPSYALSLGMAGLCDGIARILDAEGLQQVHVLGGSYGGLVAQYFVRRHPNKVRSLVLSHTFVLAAKYAKPLWIAGKLFPALPRSVLAPIIRLRLEKMLLSTLRAAKHPELELWRAYLNEAIASDLLKEVFIHQNNCLLTCVQQPQFTSEDLKEWPGKILIIESEDDPAIGAKERKMLKSIYPQAQVQTFHDAGHASSILKREEVISIVRSFLGH
jgi:pimeloyl-ACP methyl ester carboxylesterase